MGKHPTTGTMVPENILAPRKKKVKKYHFNVKMINFHKESMRKIKKSMRKRKISSIIKCSIGSTYIYILQLFVQLVCGEENMFIELPQ